MIQKLLKYISLVLPFFALNTYIASDINECKVINISDINLNYPNSTTITYVVNFNTSIMQANYVKYITDNNGTTCNSTYFKADPYYIDTLKDNDYTKTGYDRGHLVPKEDYGCDTNIISNAVPMVPDFNRGIWKSSEYMIRKYYPNHLTYKGCEYSDNYIITPTLKRLYIPIGCYYVVFDPQNIIVNYGYYENRNGSIRENRLPYWISCTI